MCWPAFTDQLIVGQNAVDPEDNLLNLFDFYILPVVNPDGEHNYPSFSLSLFLFLSRHRISMRYFQG